MYEIVIAPRGYTANGIALAITDRSIGVRRERENQSVMLAA
jgi:hypothetical protein